MQNKLCWLHLHLSVPHHPLAPCTNRRTAVFLFWRPLPEWNKRAVLMYMKANQHFICIYFQILADVLLHPTDLWMQTEKPNRLSCKCSASGCSKIMPQQVYYFVGIVWRKLISYKPQKHIQVHNGRKKKKKRPLDIQE